MRSKVSTRLALVAIAAGSLMAMPLASPVSAATGASCSKLASAPAKLVKKVLTSTATVSGCIPVAATGGSGKSVTQIGVKVNGKTVSLSKTTWAGGKGTTTETVTYANAKGLGKCPKLKGELRVLSKATVTGGTGAALKQIPKGSKGAATVCVNAKNAASLEPGTKYVF